MLVGYNATTGKRVFQTELDGTTVTAPTIIDNELAIGTFTGLVEGFSFVSGERSQTPVRPRLTPLR